jgi:NAD+ kinase
LISPIAPHNLNIRPLVVPDNAKILLRLQSRDGKFVFTADNVTLELFEDIQIAVSVAQFSLRRVRLNKSDFINALTEKLFWGEDVRNLK